MDFYSVASFRPSIHGQISWLATVSIDPNEKGASMSILPDCIADASKNDLKKSRKTRQDIKL